MSTNYKRFKDEVPFKIPRGGAWISFSCTSNPTLTLILTILLPGISHMLLGQTRKGFAIFINTSILRLLSLFPITGWFIVFPILIYYQIFLCIDAMNIALRVEEGAPVMHGECTNTVAMKAIGWACGKYPVFINTERDGLPNEWVIETQKFYENTRKTLISEFEEI